MSDQKSNDDRYFFPMTFKRKPGIIKIRINTKSLPEVETQNQEQSNCHRVTENQDMQYNQYQQRQLEEQGQMHSNHQHLDDDLFSDVRPLPFPWQMVMAPDKSFYFRHPETQQEQRERPSF